MQASTVALAAAFVLATAITYFIEKPSLQYLRVWYKNRKASYQTL